MPEALLESRDMKKYFPVTSAWLIRRVRGWVKAVDGGNFSIQPGEPLGIVVESGCGKTTTSKLVLTQEKPTAGTLHFQGRDVAQLWGRDLMQYWESVQVVFQDPFSSLPLSVIRRFPYGAQLLVSPTTPTTRRHRDNFRPSGTTAYTGA